ncbi:MAG: 23S rRNA (pseudouridine1915-N3)-methyltransferase [Paracoccaceae bacterium]|jgi:23S rRNA (pseudouridine1915-N3)-methyltransferase
MRVHICAVGRLRAGPESDLIADYLDRFTKSGRANGFGAINLTEVEDKKGGGMQAEGALLERAIPNGAVVCTLDERGKLMSSPDFANLLAGWRDQGRQDVAFVIGGADGIAPDLRAKADASVSFGKMVWPHMLARVMLSEQLYRSVSILAGAPYHRA